MALRRHLKGSETKAEHKIRERQKWYSHIDLEEHLGKRVNPRINVDNSRRVKAKDAHFLVAPRTELAFPNLAKGPEFGFWSLTELSWNPGSVN